MPTQTGSFDFSSHKSAYDNASQVATNYVTDLTNGVLVHPEGNTSDGVKITDTVEIIRDDVSVAQYGDVVRIGESGDTHISMDYHSMEMVDKDGNTYFEVADLRGSDGIATITETWVAGAETYGESLGISAINNTYTVTVSDNSGGTITKTTNGFTFSTAPTPGAIITATFTTRSADAKAYTLGARGATGGVGASSAVIGSGGVASGFNSVAVSSGEATGNLSFAANNAQATGRAAFAVGESSVAEGAFSFAGGEDSVAHGASSFAYGTGINANGGFVIGAYNDPNPYGDALFTIGDGGDDNDRSNALHVGYGGHLYIGGDIVFGDANPDGNGVGFLERFYTKLKYPTSGGQAQTTTVSGGATKWVTIDCSEDEGTLLCPCGYYINGTTMLSVYAFYKSSSYECSVALKNTGTSSVTATIEVACLYAKLV